MDMRRLIFVASYRHWYLIKMSQKVIASVEKKYHKKIFLVS